MQLNEGSRLMFFYIGRYDLIGSFMPLTSYRIFLGVTIDVTFSNEDRAELALIHLTHQLNLVDSEQAKQYQAMVAIDQLSAYIATAFEAAHKEYQVLGKSDYSIELQGIGCFVIDRGNQHWCCYREDFGSIFVQIHSPLSSLGISSL